MPSRLNPTQIMAHQTMFVPPSVHPQVLQWGLDALPLFLNLLFRLWVKWRFSPLTSPVVLGIPHADTPPPWVTRLLPHYLDSCGQSQLHLFIMRTSKTHQLLSQLTAVLCVVSSPTSLSLLVLNDALD